MNKLLSILVILGLAVGAFFLLHTQVVWLDYFDGRILKKVKDEVATVKETHTQTINSYFFEIETDDERMVTIEVDQLLYFRSREGMRVTKSPFGSTVELLTN